MQKIVVLSSAQAEYIVANDTACEAIWLWRLLRAMQEEQKEATIIFLWQHVNYCKDQEPSVPCKIKTYWIEASLYLRFSEQEKNTIEVYQYKWAASRFSHQSSECWEIWEIQKVVEHCKLRGGVKINLQLWCQWRS